MIYVPIVTPPSYGGCSGSAIATLIGYTIVLIILLICPIGIWIFIQLKERRDHQAYQSYLTHRAEKEAAEKAEFEARRAEIRKLHDQARREIDSERERGVRGELRILERAQQQS